MSGHHKLPRTDSGAHIALTALHTLDGQATEERWRFASTRPLGTKARRDQWAVIVSGLISTGMVFQRNGVFIVSDDGLEFLGLAVTPVPRADPEAAPARYVPPMRPLSAKHLVNLRSMREGAFDYCAIPSLHGEARVAFRSNLKVAGGDAAA